MRDHRCCLTVAADVSVHKVVRRTEDAAGPHHVPLFTCISHERSAGCTLGGSVMKTVTGAVACSDHTPVIVVLT